jgi:tetratricopeptide (TPR) repeat protein
VKHLRVGIAIGNLAGLYNAQGRRNEAEPYYKRALAIAEEAFGPPITPMLGAHSTIWHRMMWRVADMQRLSRFSRAASIYEQVLGPDHPDFAAVLNNTAIVLALEGCYREAEPIYQRCLAITEKTLGPA